MASGGRGVSSPSDRAMDAALAAARHPVTFPHVKDGVRAAHDPTLGLDRSVCLRDVVEALRREGLTRTWIGTEAADFLEAKFTEPPTP